MWRSSVVKFNKLEEKTTIISGQFIYSLAGPTGVATQISSLPVLAAGLYVLRFRWWWKGVAMEINSSKPNFLVENGMFYRDFLRINGMFVQLFLPAIFWCKCVKCAILTQTFPCTNIPFCNRNNIHFITAEREGEKILQLLSQNGHL